MRLVTWATIVATALLALPAAATAAGVASTFDSGADGWTVQQPLGSTGVAPTHLASGGNPGGFVRFADTDSGSAEGLGFFVAPASWDSALASDYNGTLSFDIEANGTPDGSFSQPVVLIGESSGDSALATAPAPVSQTWGTESVLLTEASNWRSASAISECPPGDAACLQSIPTLTAAQFESVLEGATDIAILGDYRIEAGDQTDFDNAGLAPAKRVAEQGTLKYKHGAHAFKGRIVSSKLGCAAGQVVTLFRKRAGPDAKRGKATTSSAGSWSLKRTATAGKYYATAPSSILGPGFDCAGVTSPILRIG